MSEICVDESRGSQCMSGRRRLESNAVNAPHAGHVVVTGDAEGFVVRVLS